MAEAFFASFLYAGNLFEMSYLGRQSIMVLEQGVLTSRYIIGLCSRSNVGTGICRRAGGASEGTFVKVISVQIIL